MFKFQWKYFILAILLFVVEVLIAIYVDDSFVRPYFGDFLVVILIYCFLKSFWNASVRTIALSVLVFSFVVEILQYFKFVTLIGLGKSKLAVVVLGNSFAWSDLLAYTLGIAFIFLIEKTPFFPTKEKPATTTEIH